MSETYLAGPRTAGSTTLLRGPVDVHEPASTRGKPLGSSTIAVWVAAWAAICVGLAMRAWFLFHQPVNADESVVGLMARQIVHGHFSAFFWGQSYGGGEPYIVAVLFAVFGTSVWALEAAAIILSVGAALLTWRIVRQLVADPALAVLAGALVWIFSRSFVSNSTVELGLHHLPVVCGLGLVLVALEIQKVDHRLPLFAILGLLAGLGWWSSPEIVYYVLPAGLLVLWAIVGDPEIERGRRWSKRLAVAGVASVIGSLPWLWANAHSRFDSLRPGAFPLPPGSPGYFGRLKIFFQDSLPMIFNLRNQINGYWLWGRTISSVVLALLLGVLIVALVLCALGGGRSLILALGVVVFPFLVALSPATWYWQDGRYVDFIVPMLAIVLTVGCAEASRRVSRSTRIGQRGVLLGRTLASGLLAVVIATTVANFAIFVNPLDTFFVGWTNPNGPTLHAIADLEAHGIDDGYADYWVAYRLDLLSVGRLQITTAGDDPDRWQSLDAQVGRSPTTAWLFVPVTTSGVTQFGGTTAIQGPGGLPEAQFLADLARQGVAYRVVDSGLIRAVIPDRVVSPSQVGLNRTG